MVNVSVTCIDAPLIRVAYALTQVTTERILTALVLVAPLSLVETLLAHLV